MGYCWACQQMGLPVNVAVVREIGLYAKDYKIQQHMEQYPQHLIDRWHTQLLKDVKEMRIAYTRLKEGYVETPNGEEILYPFNFADACTSYGGCAFAQLCLAKDPENYFSSYSHYRWNPLAKQPIKELES